MTDPSHPLAVAALGVERLGDPARLAKRFADAGARLVAVAEPEDHLREALERDLPGVPLLPLSDILADPAIPAVVVGAATPHRGPVAAAAFESGKHVAVEGPLAATVSEARAVVAAWRRAGTVGRAGRDFAPAAAEIARVAARLAANELGELHEIRTSVTVLPPPSRQAWRLDPDLGGGCLFDVGADHVALLCRLLGRLPRSVRGRTRSDPRPEDSAELRLAFESGPVAVVRVGYSDSPAERFEIVGALGRIDLERARGGLGWDDADLSGFVEAVRGHDHGEPSPSSALEALVVVDAARVSDEWQGGEVEIERGA